MMLVKNIHVTNEFKYAWMKLIKTASVSSSFTCKLNAFSPEDKHSILEG